jgi:hypothetical protein
MNNYGSLKDPALDSSRTSMSNGHLGVNRTACMKKRDDPPADVLFEPGVFECVQRAGEEGRHP